MKSKQAKCREFGRKAREEIKARDNNKCIFCAAGYRMDGATWYGQSLLSIMHYIPRSHNGLGIPQNGAVGCQYHHEMLDNGNKDFVNPKEKLYDKFPLTVHQMDIIIGVLFALIALFLVLGVTHTSFFGLFGG